jgi:hypothetical protein
MFIHFFTMYVCVHVDVGVYKYTFITHLQYSYSFFITITRVYMLCSVHPNLLTATATATTTTAAATTPFDPKLLYTSHKYTTCVVQYSRSVCAVCSDVVSHVVYMLRVTCYSRTVTASYCYQLQLLRRRNLQKIPALHASLRHQPCIIFFGHQFIFHPTRID